MIMAHVATAAAPALHARSSVPGHAASLLPALTPLHLCCAYCRTAMALMCGCSSAAVVLQRCATDPDALCSLAQQLAKQGARHEQLIARLQEQLSEQRQQYTSMQAGLQRQLQELHAEVQQLRQ